VKCVVINGCLDAFLSEGGKRASFLSHIAEDDAHDLGETPVGALLSLLRESSKTIVCVINGQVVGGLGLEFIMSCDYRVCSPSSEFVGDLDLSSTVLSAVSTPYLMHPPKKSQCSVSEIMHALLSGGTITAVSAKDISLIDELVDDSDSVAVACQIGLKHRKRRRLLSQLNSSARLVHFLPDQFLLYRSSQLFNLIRDYPSSLSAIEELCTVLQLTCQYDFVANSIKTQLQDRLLIPGAHTEDILQMYLRTNKVVSLLFKNSNRRRSDVFQKVTSSVIHHLHKRKDSVKCIVSTLLENEDCEDEKTFIDNCSDDDFEWVPNPTDAQGDETISLLIGVYGGQTYFLSEYREMLASRLVSLGSFEIDREIASLDLMKSKFDPNALNDCNIMIKDMIESRRVFQKIKAKLIKVKNHHLLPSSLILSKHFWPSKIVGDSTDEPDGSSNCGDQFKFLPPEILTVMKEYEKLFTELKPTQRLEWKRSEGIVVIQINIRNRDYEFRVSPLFVEVLSLFQSLAIASCSAKSSPLISASAPSSMTIEDIAKSIQQPNETVKQIVAFWVSKNVLREIDINRFVINE
jgi:hypothetical protein